jgi:hypothetical protein
VISIALQAGRPRVAAEAAVRMANAVTARIPKTDAEDLAPGGLPQGISVALDVMVSGSGRDARGGSATRGSGGPPAQERKAPVPQR